MPEWARHLTGTYLPAPVRRLYLEPNARFVSNVVRWSYPELPCKQLAVERATGRGGALNARQIA